MHTTPAITSETPRTAPAQQALLPWLDMLRQLYPPRALLVVGAGNGRNPWVQYLMAANYDNVTLVEADEPTAARLKLVAQAQPSWKVHGLLVGRSSGPTRFYTASLQPESGLLEPESLRNLWPNLKTTHKQTRQAIALAELQQDTEPSANWLLVDCLPALPIIQGATQQLAAFDVIALRVLLGNTQDTANGNGESKSNTNNDELAQSASSHALHTTLQALGFRCLAIETSRNPAIGHALFVRDTVALAQKLQQQLAQQTQTQAQAEDATAAAIKQTEECVAQVRQLTQAKAAADQLANERQEKLDQLQTQLKQATERAQTATQEAEKAKADAVTANKATSTATTATEAAIKQTEECVAQVRQLTQAKAVADQLANERQEKLDQLQTQLKQATERAQVAVQEAEKTKAATTAAAAAAAKQAEAQAKTIASLTKEIDSSKVLARDRIHQLDKLEATNCDLQKVHLLLTEEIKAIEIKIHALTCLIAVKENHART